MLCGLWPVAVWVWDLGLPCFGRHRFTVADLPCARAVGLLVRLVVFWLDGAGAFAVVKGVSADDVAGIWRKILYVAVVVWVVLGLVRGWVVGDCCGWAVLVVVSGSGWGTVEFWCCQFLPGFWRFVLFVLVAFS
ncbi:YaeQ family protein [Thalassobaculum litoreum]|uniref:YaeQ family protein n=1 Tax=Thalassobaculum litoreum TaxID=420996 RepID=UPI003CCBC87B